MTYTEVFFKILECFNKINGIQNDIYDMLKFLPRDEDIIKQQYIMLWYMKKFTDSVENMYYLLDDYAYKESEINTTKDNRMGGECRK